jgi:hypothetical protein
MTTTSRNYKKFINSRDKSAELAKKARILQFEKDWDYERAVSYIAETEPDFFEEAINGAVSEDTESEFMFTWKEADDLLNEQIEAKMKDGMPFDEAFDKVHSDPKNSEKVKCYIFNR